MSPVVTGAVGGAICAPAYEVNVEDLILPIHHCECYLSCRETRQHANTVGKTKVTKRMCLRRDDKNSSCPSTLLATLPPVLNLLSKPLSHSATKKSGATEHGLSYGCHCHCIATRNGTRGRFFHIYSVRSICWSNHVRTRGYHRILKSRRRSFLRTELLFQLCQKLGSPEWREEESSN